MRTVYVYILQAAYMGNMHNYRFALAIENSRPPKLDIQRTGSPTAASQLTSSTLFSVPGGRKPRLLSVDSIDHIKEWLSR
jgi:hypothetical protein